MVQIRRKGNTSHVQADWVAPESKIRGTVRRICPYQGYYGRNQEQDCPCGLAFDEFFDSGERSDGQGIFTFGCCRDKGHTSWMAILALARAAQRELR
jgi:hypothetical protein